MLEKTEKREALFWAKVLKPEDYDEDTCWPWQGSTSEWGYGQIGTTTDGVREKFYAHIVSHHWYVAEVPKGQVVRHTCDNPPCVRPSHLVSGTHQENMGDMVERGRHVGSRSIDEIDVVLIRERRASGTESSTIAAEYGFSEQHVNAICRGRFWPEAGGPLTARVKISDGLLHAILKDKGSITQKECAELHGVSKPAVQQIWSGFRKPRG